MRAISAAFSLDFDSSQGLFIVERVASLTFVSKRLRSFCLCWERSLENLLDSNLAFSRMDSKRAWCPTVILELKRSKSVLCSSSSSVSCVVKCLAAWSQMQVFISLT